jgi:hypothetical protein
MKKSELKILIKECLVEESLVQESTEAEKYLRKSIKDIKDNIEEATYVDIPDSLDEVQAGLYELISYMTDKEAIEEYANETIDSASPEDYDLSPEEFEVLVEDWETIKYDAKAIAKFNEGSPAASSPEVQKMKQALEILEN